MTTEWTEFGDPIKCIDCDKVLLHARRYRTVDYGPREETKEVAGWMVEYTEKPITFITEKGVSEGYIFHECQSSD